MSKRFLMWQSVMAGIQVLSGAGALTGVLGERWAGLFVVLVAACQAGTMVYQHGLMTPVPDK
jgi:hypothetical protein